MPKSSAKKAGQGTKVVAVTLGDPQGIGPEVVAKSVALHSPAGSLVIVGERRFFPGRSIRVIEDVRLARPGETALLEVPAKGAAVDPSFSWVRAAVELGRQGCVQAVVTGPVRKEKWLASGLPYRGHTDYLATVARGGPPAMFFWSPGLKVALFTHHLPLREVFGQLEPRRIAAFVRGVDAELRRLFARGFTYLFSGFNPHAGEGGHLGSEELDCILPAMDDLRRDIPVAGMFPPDVVFAKARFLEGAVVIAWTHDQGLIPFKLLHSSDGVQLTLGLPFVRTSPVHGTAVDIAGRGIADPTSMLAAIRLAEALIP
ncbi:MAG: 4-hydroxythreonine-4-phosphate dehydrogenase PdxA [Candidatus Aminicenantes bacterium]|nr:4-hydroxythreonine-4-phosphate dehydrogenase PdxA [Candidatus Aminicenantes bacterium]